MAADWLGCSWCCCSPGCRRDVHVDVLRLGGHTRWHDGGNGGWKWREGAHQTTREPDCSDSRTE
eukprot:3659956-Prymnesium_polylepis.1